MTINDMYNYLLKKGYKPYTLATISVEELKKLYKKELEAHK